MAASNPFTLYLSVVPDRGPSSSTAAVRKGGRWVYLRQLQRLARESFDALVANATNLTLAKPGANVEYSSGQFQNMSEGMSYKPQIGNQPDLLMVEGFYAVAAGDQSAQVAASTTRISSNEAMTGPAGQQPARTGGMPSSTMESEVKALKTEIESALSTGAVVDADSAAPKVFRLIYRGVVWGDRGHHFPR